VANDFSPCLCKLILVVAVSDKQPVLILKILSSWTAPMLSESDCLASELHSSDSGSARYGLVCANQPKG
jgi:hypothetical protein